MAVAVGEIGNLSKPRRQRQRQQQRRETKGLMSRTIAVHVRFESLYISLPFSAKQQREMTKFCVCWRTYATSANILDFVMKLIAGYSGPRGFLLFFIGKFCDANRLFFFCSFPKKRVGRAMGNEIFYGDGLIFFHLEICDAKR